MPRSRTSEPPRAAAGGQCAASGHGVAATGPCGHRGAAGGRAARGGSRQAAGPRIGWTGRTGWRQARLAAWTIAFAVFGGVGAVGAFGGGGGFEAFGGIGGFEAFGEGGEFEAFGGIGGFGGFGPFGGFEGGVGFARAAAAALDGAGAGLGAVTEPGRAAAGGSAIWVAARDGHGLGVAGATIEVRAGAPFAAAGPCQPIGDEAVVARALLDDAGGTVVPVGNPGVWRLVVRAPQKVPAQAWIAVQGGEEAVARVWLEEDVPDQVRFVGPDGHPIAGALAVADSSAQPITESFPWTDPVLRGESGTDGLLRLPASDARIWRLAVAAFGFAPWSGDLVTERVTLRPATPRGLRVLDAQGRPLAAARLWEAASCADLGLTDSRGEIALAPALAGHRLVIAAPDGRRWGGEPGGLQGAPALTTAGRPVTPAEGWQWRLPEPHEPLAGRLLAAPGGRAVAGAMVWSGEDPAAWTRSDEAGRFRLPWPVRGDRFDLHVTADGFLPVVERRHPASGDAADPDLVLAPAAPLAGRVVDELGQPIAGAEVEATTDALPSARARSGADGSFLLRGIWPHAVYRIVARAGGHALAGRAVETSAGAPGQAPEPLAAFSLCRQLPLELTVRDPAGAPVAGAVVSVETAARSAGARSLRTGPDGSFTLPSPPSVDLALAVSAPGFAPLARVWQALTFADAEQQQQCEAVRRPPRLELSPTFTFGARVVDSAGQPVAGAEVWEGPPAHRLATSGPDGRFAVPGLDPTQERVLRICRAGLETAAIEARPPKAGRQAGQPAIGELPGRSAGLPSDAGAPRRADGVAAGGEGQVEREPVAITLGPAAQIAGTVVRPDGSPAVDVDVTATPDGSGPTGKPTREPCPVDAYGAAARTDAAGRFVMTPLRPRNRYRVVADDGARGIAFGEPPELPAGTTIDDLRLVLGLPTRIVGRLRDAAGDPVTGEIDIKRLYLSTRSDEEGRFTLAPLHPAGESEEAVEVVEARGPGGLTVSRLVALHAGDNALDLVLPDRPLRRISGRLLDARGAAVAGATLKLNGAAFHDRQWWAGSGPDGSFVFKAVPAGEYELWLLQTFADHHVKPARLVVAGGDMDDLAVQYLAVPEIALHGRVTDSTGRSGMEVTADGPGRLQTAAVGPDGKYRIEHLVPGLWVLRARDGAVEGPVTYVNLLAGQADVAQDLGFRKTRVSGRVVGRRNDPVSGLTLILEPGLAVARTAADGTFSFTALADIYGVYLALPADPPSLKLPARLEVGREDLAGVELVYAAVTVHGKVLGLRPGDGTVRIDLSTATGESVHSATAAADGSFSLAGVAAGRWRLEASLVSGEKARRDVDVPAAAADMDLELAIERGSLALAGRLQGARDPDLFAVEIRREDGGYVATMPVDSAGSFRFVHLAPGDYVLTAAAETNHGRVTAGTRKVALRRSGTVELAIDGAVQAIREAPLEPVD